MNFRTQALISLLTTLDRRTNTTDDDADGSNIVQDSMWPIAERLTTSDTITASYFTPSTFVWGNGGVTTDANWTWGYGGAWQS